MAFDKYKDGAWMEPEDSVRKNITGVWEDCDSVKRLIDGAWTEVWANIRYMIEKSNTITKGFLDINNDGNEFAFYRMQDVEVGYGSQSGGGTIIFYLDGSWTNPNISFDWEGGFIKKQSLTSDKWSRGTAGSIQYYARKTDGTEVTGNLVQTVGSTLVDTNVMDEYGSYNGDLTGEFDRLGISIYISSYGGQYYNSTTTMKIYNLLFDGRKIRFPADSVFDLQEW